MVLISNKMYTMKVRYMNISQMLAALAVRKSLLQLNAQLREMLAGMN